ncbi:MAG TPA: phenylalanine--tRNA ligase subunit beta, partial [Gammaproteobacteria bacterium]|nr:phenylalanine--tRNA ligase subunit beta [Gammaproteobacteria bacterium]
MRVNVEWLRDWVDFDIEAAQLADLLTTSGLEVDAVLPAADAFNGVVVAEVVACGPHPDADRLRVCEVSDGHQKVTVVCGAPNVRAGLRVALARVGAALPGGRTIEAAKIRGVASAGMLCSALELGISDDAGGILELPEDADIGMDLRELLRLDDQILDVDLTPNRGDCFSVIGIAREIAAGLGKSLRDRRIDPVPAALTDRFPVKLEAPDGCPRFVGRVIRGVGRATSPTWLVERLRRAGVRAIQPVVDVTNYVMLELGQPLHAYDLGRLGGEIRVRYAAPGEKLTLLDGRQVDLDPDLVVIADNSGPIGLAGIMGGQSTAVEEGSSEIFLEAAYFPPAAVSGRARRFGLHTDAATRFERGVDPENQIRAIERATALLLEIAGGDAGPTTETVARDHLPRAADISLRGDRIAGLLGHALPPETVERSLELLGMRLAADGANAWRVTPPSYRFDLTIEEDLVEEVARHVGYDRLPAIAELSASRLGTAVETRVDVDRIADLLVAHGYSEAICYRFVDPSLAELVNPSADQLRLANPI